MDSLFEEISIEKEYIKETLRLLEEALNRPEKSAIELSAIGSFLHHIYTGMENILKRIIRFKNINIPDSTSSHKDLLSVAVGQKIISQELSDQLDTYRGFRHFFVHAYGVQLETDKLNPLVEELPTVWNRFEQEIQTFLKRLKTS